jgi:hypothetical protein
VSNAVACFLVFSAWCLILTWRNYSRRSAPVSAPIGDLAEAKPI